MASNIDTPPSAEPSTIELEKAEEIKKDQGFHECEVSTSTDPTQAEIDLHKRYEFCEKNRDHKDFIPANEFTIDHLPEGYRNNDIFAFIKAMINLTVCMCCNYFSLDRPETFPKTNDQYPFYNYRGKRMTQTGTGIVWDVMNFTDEYRRKYGIAGRTCECKQCKDSGEPKTEWCRVDVATAKHVVFDHDEARQTRCCLFYDSDSMEEKKKILELEGETMRDVNNVDFDRSMIICYIHDLELGKKLEKMLKDYKSLYRNVCEKFVHSKIEYPLCVIAFHPHGCSKQVTVGEMKNREKMDGIGYGTRYTYTAQTCPGSSGAPVFVAGMTWLYGLYPHSQRCKEEGLNMSGIWIDQ